MNRLTYLLLLLSATGLLALSSPSSPSFQSHLPQGGGWMDTLLRQTEAHIQQNRHRSFFLHTDRTLYGQGGTIWGTVYGLRAVDHLPDSLLVQAQSALVNPQNRIVASQRLVFGNGKAEMALSFPATLPGGLYKLQIYDPLDTDRADIWVEKEITVHQPIYPRLRMKLQLARAAHRPGETAEAFVSLQTLEDQPLADFTYQWSLQSRNQILAEGQSITGSAGRDTLQVPLPDSLRQARVLINLVIDYQGNRETISRSVEMIQEDLNLQFLPEGGTWLAGYPQNLAFKALDPQGKGRDCKGEILDIKGRVVASFSSAHKGMGSVSFTPEQGSSYTARVEGISRKFAILAADSRGYGLSLHKRDDQQLVFRLISPHAETLHLLGRLRGRVYEAYRIEARAGVNFFPVPISRFPAGAAAFTLFNDEGQPQAERLVFLHQHQNLKIEVEPEHPYVKPGTETRATIRVRDDQGNPVPASLSLAVVDDRNLSLADDKQPGILAQMLLCSEVRGEVEEADFYFDPEEKEAISALDKLMLTQGWRRFAWKEVRNADPDIWESSPRAQRLAGQLRYRKTNKPVAGAKLTIFHIDGDWWADQVLTDSMGYFSFPHRVTGLIHLEITGKGVSKQPVDLGLDKSSYEVLKNKVRNTQPYWYRRNHSSDINLIELKSPVSKAPALVRTGRSDVSVLPRIPDARSTDIITSSVSLDEVVIVGYGQAKKRALSSAIRVVEHMEMIAEKPVQALNGAVAGLSLTQANGLPEADQALKIRGTRSISGNPIYIIDGVPVQGPALTQIDPASIASIEVLKAGNAAIYGCQSAMGVILINTRNHLSGRTYGHWNIPRKGHFMVFDMGPPPQNIRKFYAAGYQSFLNSPATEDKRMTIHWEPNLFIGQEGEAEVRFRTPAKPTTYSISVMGVSQQGQLGQGQATFANMPPIALQAEMPATLTVGDKVSLPVTIRNNQDHPVKVALAISQSDSTLLTRLETGQKKNISLEPQSGRTVMLPFLVQKAGQGRLGIRLKGWGQVDQVEQSFSVKPKGFPFVRTVAGSDSVFQEEIILGDMVPGTVGIEFQAYAGLLQEMQEGRDAMLRQPHGCFEQTSSSNFPNVLALNLMRSVVPNDQVFEEQAMRFIKAGHQRMKGFETPGEGFSLWGKNPANLHMSARGLLQFWWMAQVYPQTDLKVIARTKAWLLNQRNGQGRFNTTSHWRYKGKLAAPLSLHALVCYALAKTGNRSIQPELDWMYQEAAHQESAYLKALCSRALLAYGDTARGRRLVREMMHKRNVNGWDEKGRTAMGGYGNSFQTELNALCLLAALDSRLYTASDLAPQIAYLQARRKGGRFGSTMTTVLVLEAFALFHEQYRQSAGEGTLDLWIDGQYYQQLQYGPAGVESALPENQAPALGPGKHTVEVRQQGTKDPIAFSISFSGFDRTPPAQAGCRITLQQHLSADKVEQGELVGLDLTVRNTHFERVGNPMLCIGIPAGVQLPLWQLKEMQDRGEFAYYELHEDQLWIYLEYLEPQLPKTLHIDLEALIPGSYEAHASSAYLYYNDQHKDWKPGLRLQIIQP